MANQTGPISAIFNSPPRRMPKAMATFFCVFFLFGKTVDCQWSDTVFGLDQLTKGSVVDFIWTIPYDSNYKRIAIKISKHQRWKTTVPQLKDVHGQCQNPLTKKSDRFHNHCNLLTLLEQTRMGIGLPIKSPEVMLKCWVLSPEILIKSSENSNPR